MDVKGESFSGRSKKGFPGIPGEEPPKTEFKTYILVWLGIIILTGITLALSQANPGRWGAAIVLYIAGTQSALVLYYFMRLRDEKALIFKILIPLVLTVLFVFMALTFSDIAFRG